jgi:predicted RNase H-like HicB family nuclease
MKYFVKITKNHEGYTAQAVGLPGCWSEGDTEKEALANIEIAIQEYLAVSREQAGTKNLREIEVAI